MLSIHLIVSEFHNLGILKTDDMLKILKIKINSSSGKSRELHDIFYKMANVYFYRLELDKGKKCMETCKRLSGDLDESSIRFKLGNLDIFWNMINDDFSHVFEGAVEQLKLAKENSMEDLLVYPYSQISLGYYFSGMWDGSLEYGFKALKQAREYTMGALEKNMLAFIAQIYLKKDDLENAGFFLGESEKVECENIFAEINSLTARVDFMVQANRFTEAEMYLNSAFQKARNIEDKTNIYKLKCIAYFIKSRVGRSSDHIESEQLFQLIKDNRFILKYHNPLLLIAKEYEENNDYRSSNEIYKEALRHEIQTGKRISQLKESDRDLDLKLKQIINDNEILRGELSELKSRNTKLVSKLEKTKRSYDDWKLLQKAAGAMTSTMNPDKVLDMAYDYANKLADIDFMTVGLYDSKLGKLDYMFSVKEGRRIAGHAVNVTPKTLERYLLDRESPTFIEDVVEFSYKRFRVNKFLFEGVKNLTFIPMTLDKEKIGYMGISTDYHEMESGEKIKALKILSSHFAAAYENARESKRLAKEIRIKAENQKELKRINDMLFKISRQDGLTGLYNKHALFRDLGIMVENKNMHNNICAIMVDIDYFKDYNDHYGHLAGDAALKRISEFLLKENMGIKRVYRYGGDEMLIIIDDIKDDAAVSSICSNIIKGVRGLNICHDYSQVSNNITVTVGAALHKTKYKELKYKELLNIADIALYKAKKKGRNCFEIVVKGTGL